MAKGLAEDLKIMQKELEEQKKLRAEADALEAERVEYLKQLEAYVD